MRAYPARLATPSCTRAPPESLMNTNGVPVFMDAFMVSAILLACTSPAEPPATVKSRSERAFLHARAARIVDEHERRPGLHGRFHGVGDLVGMHLARRAARHGEILACQMDRPPANAAAPGDHSIGGQILVAHAEEPAVVLGEQPRLLKGIAVQQQRDALPCGQFSAFVLLGGALRPAPQFEPVPGLPELRSLVL